MILNIYGEHKEKIAMSYVELGKTVTIPANTYFSTSWDETSLKNSGFTQDDLSYLDEYMYSVLVEVDKNEYNSVGKKVTLGIKMFSGGKSVSIAYDNSSGTQVTDARIKIKCLRVKV